MSRASILLPVVAVVLFSVHPQALLAQEQERKGDYVELDDGSNYWVRVRVGGAFVFEANGPPHSGYEESEVNYKWLVVQDSALGVVFRGKAGFKSSGSTFDGDIDARALADIEAVEFGVITFNVWKEYTGTWFVTDIAKRNPMLHPRFSIDPRIYPCVRDSDSPVGYSCYDIHKHLTSITNVARVRYSDGTIVVADLQPALEAAHLFSGDVTVEDLEPDDPMAPPGPKDLVQT